MHKTARHLTFIFTLITAMTVLHAQAAQDLVLTSDALPDSASVDFRHKSWKLSHTGTQGMDTYGNYLVSLKAEGICQVYSFDGKTLTALTNDFHLGSYDPINHANLASFSNQFYADGDKLPLVYISRTSWNRDEKGYSNYCFVERINPDNSTSTLVQTIIYKDWQGSGQWMIDRQNNYLYLWGNTAGNKKTGNKHYVVKFNIPAVSKAGADTVYLGKEDALENYLWEDTYSQGAVGVIQGGCVYDDMMFLPTGYDTDDDPSVIWIWDLKNRTMVSQKNFSGILSGELEDVSIRNNKIVIQTHNGYIYQLNYKKDAVKYW